VCVCVCVCVYRGCCPEFSAPEGKSKRQKKRGRRCVRLLACARRSASERERARGREYTTNIQQSTYQYHILNNEIIHAHTTCTEGQPRQTKELHTGYHVCRCGTTNPNTIALPLIALDKNTNNNHTHRTILIIIILIIILTTSYHEP